MKIVLLDEAQARFIAEDLWWREHRDAKELFVTRCHVYYFHDAGSSVIEIHSIWSARRRRAPDL